MKTIQDIVTEFGDLNATAISSERAIAFCILRRLDGYRHNSKHLREDADFLELALQAYAKLLQDHDVKVVS